MDEPKGHYRKWNKSETDKYHGISYVKSKKVERMARDTRIVVIRGGSGLRCGDVGKNGDWS